MRLHLVLLMSRHLQGHPMVILRHLLVKLRHLQGHPMVKLMDLLAKLTLQKRHPMVKLTLLQGHQVQLTIHWTRPLLVVLRRKWPLEPQKEALRIQVLVEQHSLHHLQARPSLLNRPLVIVHSVPMIMMKRRSKYSMCK